MFCPKCAAQNQDGASYCRVCGANISLVPQALAGQLTPSHAEDDPIYTTRSGRRKRRRVLTLDIAVKNMFMGVAFLIISIALSRTIGAVWWFWMLIPAFSLMGTGVAQYMRLKENKASFNSPPSFPDRVAPPLREIQRRNTGELMPPPPSVTEGTTRHLGVEAATRHLDPSGDQK
jgi:zinc ribbon protein